jgi:hypothetical protein
MVKPSNSAGASVLNADCSRMVGMVMDMGGRVVEDPNPAQFDVIRPFGFHAGLMFLRTQDLNLDLSSLLQVGIRFYCCRSKL